MAETVRWLGNEFLVCDPQTTTWESHAGVYIFCGSAPDQRHWRALYVGQAQSFADRLPSHDRWREAVAQGGHPHPCAGSCATGQPG